MRGILVTGALGQIGAELTPALRERYGATRVVASDLSEAQPADDSYERLDCAQAEAVADLIERREIGVIYHLAALLSAVAEERPQAAWSVNMNGLYNVLEAARHFGCQVFFPSSIAAFGPSTPRRGTPQATIQRPTTIYGVTKVAGELLCDYYAIRFGVDARGLRLPGLVSWAAPPGGGTTDYAVEMFHAAARRKPYSCFLAAETRLDMMYMPDAVRAIIELMEADPQRLRYQNAYNVTGMSVTPHEIAAQIRQHVPSFAVDYRIDPLRQAIADSWPQSLDSSAAREDWGFSPRFDLVAMTRDMLARLGETTGPFEDPISNEVENANARFG
ncbi:NAD-dependent epimerase/dehydratase family protein [Methylocystis sp. B8]|uniref:NAD-dependent epimerase/dehydratase family protein n=1 Tax=Methylocystis sp. B8 TaxID=544938 RepID=UPI0010FF2A75|nr:NAD-dependent epimerase/dehydratase family protein [Methylocystis sp. B8]TLG77765.1 NAD-dependent epimerase/dehydratase family protein [Methylocystis sp. B8]